MATEPGASAQTPRMRKAHAWVGRLSAGRGAAETEVTEARATSPRQPRSRSGRGLGLLRRGEWGPEAPDRSRVLGGASGSYAACTRQGGLGRWGWGGGAGFPGESEVHCDCSAE